MSLNTTWEYNGHKFELDLTDADTIERSEDAFALMQEEEKKLPKDGKTSVKIRAYCSLFRKMFDSHFGEGAGNAIIGEKDSIANCHAAYDSFLAFVAEQADARNNFANELNKKYTNRAQRRAAAKKKK